jgi:hypothetical protein
MSPILSATGEPVNWMNYITGVKHVYFRMDVTVSYARISIELKHPDPVQQKEYYDRLKTVKEILEQETGESWKWEEGILDEDGASISRIEKTLYEVNVLNEDDWPAIISFLKPRLIALDSWWVQVKDVLA